MFIFNIIKYFIFFVLNRIYQNQVLHYLLHFHIHIYKVYSIIYLIFFFFCNLKIELNIGSSMWTKLIRNKKAVEYLFNAESYDFNYQFENRLTKRIQIYPVNHFNYFIFSFLKEMFFLFF